MSTSTILLLASIQAFFLAVLLVSKQKKHLSDIVLSIWLLFIGLHMFIYYSSAKIHLQSSILMNLNAGFPFLQGPFLYFYVKARTMQKPKLRLIYVIHLLPFIFFTFYVVFLLNTLNIPQNVKHVNIHIFSLPYYFNAILLGSVPLYVAWSFLLLRKYQTRILNSYSTIDKINLKWLRYIITGMGLVWLTVISVFVMMKSQGLSQTNNVIHFIFMAINIFVYAIGYFGFKQTNIFSNVNVEIENPPEKSKESSIDFDSFEKYQKSSISENDAFELLNQLNKYMETEKPYLSDKLTLPQVADELDVSINHLSQIINEQTDQNFFDFVNAYRVEEVKQRLLNPQNDVYSILGIAYECGFGSKSSFNRIFKNITGQTPSQYKMSISK